MDATRSQKAIQHALSQNWREAININQQILEENPEDIESLNRLAYAYLKTGNISASKTTYKRVIKIDKYNPIALKNLKWLTNLTKSDIHQNDHVLPTPTIFLEEPGKTKTVSLVHLAPFTVLCNIMTAQQMRIVSKKYSIEIRDRSNIYIGALPDDLSHRLLRLIASGNTYDVYTKNVTRNNVTVFIKELKKGKRLAHIPSFSLLNHVQNLQTSNSNEDDDTTSQETDTENEE